MNPTYFKEEEVIRSVMDFNYRSGSSSSFDIAYGIDKNFLFGCGVSIASVLLANPQIDFSFHVFTDFLDDDDKAKFEALAKQYHSRIVVYLIDCERLKSLPSTKNWTYATYFRFIIADYFTGKSERVLYIDADIACQGSLQQVIDLTFDDEIAAVVSEGDREWWHQRAERLNAPALVEGYFNAGFLLINIPLWNAASISSRAIEMLNDPEMVARITHLDQDVLNVLLAGKVRFIDAKFNTRYSINYELKENFKHPITDETVLIHYIGPTKPWHSWANYISAEPFLRAKEASPWIKSSLLEPKSSHQMRYCAKHLLNQNLVFEGIKSYIKYFVYKLKKI
jgi:UDP-D-galactose:(glucosyl)LPS alpha-1,3-D-galactosyltransferase